MCSWWEIDLKNADIFCLFVFPSLLQFPDHCAACPHVNTLTWAVHLGTNISKEKKTFITQMMVNEEVSLLTVSTTGCISFKTLVLLQYELRQKPSVKHLWTPADDSHQQIIWFDWRTAVKRFEEFRKDGKETSEWSCSGDLFRKT